MMNLCFSLYENKFKKKPLPTQWSLHPLRVTSLWSVGLRQISPVPGGQKPQRGTNGRCSTLVEESNGVQAAVNDR